MEAPFKLEVALPIIIGGFLAVYYFVRWWTKGQAKPDPWGEEVEQAIQREETPSLCPRCLTPHTDDEYFCEHCGLPIGPYVNWSPYLYIFSMGDALLTGVTRKFVVKPLTIAGYLLLSLGQYTLLVPLYWFRFFRHLREARTAASPPDAVPPG